MVHEEIAAAYRRFAENEAHGRSPLYETFALEVAGDRALLARLAALPSPKRQPNLLFAAVRHVAGLAGDWAAFRKAALARWDEVRAVMMERSTQTNEPGRCAVLLPILARLPQPLALLEVGASAGLCLLPDRYGYDYSGRTVLDQALPAGTPMFPCEADAATPIPASMPQIVWRVGLDLHPLDLGDTGQMEWLEELVWPDNAGRAARLRQAVAVARADPPRLVRGDLQERLASLAAEAPQDATLVVFHTAVLAYVPDRLERTAFAQLVRSLSDYWVSNEAPRVFPDIAAHASGESPRGRFLLSVNGMPVAWTDPHGASMEWVPGASVPPKE